MKRFLPIFLFIFSLLIVGCNNSTSSTSNSENISSLSSPSYYRVFNAPINQDLDVVITQNNAVDPNVGFSITIHNKAIYPVSSSKTYTLLLKHGEEWVDISPSQMIDLLPSPTILPGESHNFNVSFNSCGKDKCTEPFQIGKIYKIVVRVNGKYYGLDFTIN